jgi:hypothetical protein
MLAQVLSPTSAPAKEVEPVRPPAIEASPREYRWRVVDDPPPPPTPTRYQRLYTFLYEYNRY